MAQTSSNTQDEDGAGAPSAERLGVLGAGAMGRGIAQTAAVHGVTTVIVDVSEPVLLAARDAVGVSLGRAVEKGRLSREQADAAAGRIEWRSATADFADCTVVIEAVPEDLTLKRRVLRAAEDVLPQTAVLASNTSSLSVAAIGEALERPERFAALHFFNPAPAMALVELAAGPGVAADAVARLEALGRALGKTVVRCADTPGFIVNRCARPYYGEALALLEDGRSAAEIDAACVAAGYRLGPFALIDLIGADVNLAATESLSAAFGGHPRYHVFGALKSAVAQGALGRKSGRGFRAPGAEGEAVPPRDAAEIVARIEATLVNEAAHLAAGGAASEADIDTALTLGLNFPRGPFEMLAAAGPAATVARLQALEAAAPPALQGRYEPADFLRAKADPLWAALAPPERGGAYDNMAAIAGSAEYPPHWARLAAAFREPVAVETVSYGDDPRHEADIFRPAGAARGLVLFLHGGYWKRLDKSFWSHLAAGPLAAGCAVAIPSYRLAPAARLTEILADAKAAVLRVAAATPEAPISLVGHSAGGQLVTRLLCADIDWPAEVAARLRGAVSVSGLHELRPLMGAPAHADLRLDLAEAKALSPALHAPAPGRAFRIWVGGDELAAFHAQAEVLALAWASMGAEAAVHTEPGADHFTILDGLASPHGALCREATEIALGGPR